MGLASPFAAGLVAQSALPFLGGRPFAQPVGALPFVSGDGRPGQPPLWAVCLIIFGALAPASRPPALRDASLIRYPAFYCVGLCIRPAAETPGGQFTVLPRTRRSSPVAAPPKAEQRPERLAQSIAPLKRRRSFLNSGGSRFWWAVVCAKARAAAGASLL